jgi:membrane protein DedA with SNARE-associated domain
MDPILFISDLIAKLGYVGVALAMFIEALFPPIPSEIVLPFAGFAAAQGKLSFIGVLVSATVGSIVGATVLYLFGKLVTESHLKKLVKKPTNGSTNTVVKPYSLAE